MTDGVYTQHQNADGSWCFAWTESPVRTSHINWKTAVDVLRRESPPMSMPSQSRIRTDDVDIKLLGLDHETLPRLLRQACLRLALIRGTNESHELHHLLEIDMACRDFFAEVDGD